MNQKKFEETVERLKSSEIQGAITGSCLIPGDKEGWEEMPDIDIFCYSVGEWADAISMLINKHNYKFGTVENPSLDKQEKWKYRNTISKGIWKIGLSTVKVYKNGININVTIHKGQRKALDIISNFDMTLICRAYDIPTKHMMDYSKVWASEYAEVFSIPQHLVQAENFVTPNPHKLSDEYDVFTAQRWLRQWDRVIKYWNRGFNTIEVARFYVRMIDEVLSTGNIFASEKSKEMFEENTQGLSEVKDMISNWITEKEKEIGVLHE